jgi:hypothetical protein
MLHYCFGEIFGPPGTDRFMGKGNGLLIPIPACYSVKLQKIEKDARFSGLSRNFHSFKKFKHKKIILHSTVAVFHEIQGKELYPLSVV